MRSLEQIVALLPRCSSVCLSGTGVYCDHRVHLSADLTLRLDSPMSWAPWHQSMSTYSQPSFPVSPEREVGMDVQTTGMISQERLKIDVKLLLGANMSKSCRVDWRNNGWPWMTLNGIIRIARYLCGIAELLVVRRRQCLSLSACQIQPTCNYFRFGHHIECYFFALQPVSNTKESAQLWQRDRAPSRRV